MYFHSPLRLVYEVLGCRTQPLGASRLLDSNVCAFDACIKAGPARLATTTSDLSNFTPVACLLGYACSGRHLLCSQITGVAQGILANA